MSQSFFQIADDTNGRRERIPNKTIINNNNNNNDDNNNNKSNNNNNNNNNNDNDNNNNTTAKNTTANNNFTYDKTENSTIASNSKSSVETSLKSLDSNQTTKNKIEKQRITATSSQRIYHKTKDMVNQSKPISNTYIINHGTDNSTNQLKTISNTNLTNHSTDNLTNQLKSINVQLTNHNIAGLSPKTNQSKFMNHVANDSVIPLKVIPQLHSLQLKNDENKLNALPTEVNLDNSTNDVFYSKTLSSPSPVTPYNHTQNQDNFLQNQRQKEIETGDSKPTKSSVTNTQTRTSPYYPTIDFQQKQYLEQKFNQMNGGDNRIEKVANHITEESKMMNQSDHDLANRLPQIANQNQDSYKGSISNQSDHPEVVHVINPANDIQKSITTTAAPSQITSVNNQSNYTSADHVSQKNNQNQGELSTTAAPFELVINVQNDKVKVGRKGGGNIANKGGVRISWVKESESPDQNIVQFESVRKKNIITDQATIGQQNQTAQKELLSYSPPHEQTIQTTSILPLAKPLQKPSPPTRSNKKISRDSNDQSDVTTSSSSKAWTMYPSNPNSNGLNLSVLSASQDMKSSEKTSLDSTTKIKMNSNKRLISTKPRHQTKTLNQIQYSSSKSTSPKHMKKPDVNKESVILTAKPPTPIIEPHQNQKNTYPITLNKSNIARNLLDQPELKRLIHEVLTNRDQNFKKVNNLVGKLQKIVQKGLHSEHQMENQVDEMSSLMQRKQLDKKDNGHTLASALTILTGLVGLVKRVEQQQRKNKITPVMEKDFEELQGKLDEVMN